MNCEEKILSTVLGIKDKLNETNELVARLDERTLILPSLHNKVDRLSVDVSALKVKSGIWGGIAGLIPVSILLVINWFRSKF